MKILILGASGMLGHMLFGELLRRGLDVYGGVRHAFPCRKAWQPRLLPGLDACNMETVRQVLDDVRPDVCINAVGLIRQIPEGRKILPCLQINSVLPWQLLELCRPRHIRLIHYSTDCVFDGQKGSPYVEDDPATATDIYGRTKSLGEVRDEHALTLRTSLLGPELRGKHSLLEWFLSQEGPVNGYTDALFTGLPTSEHARIMADYVLPRTELYGLYQVSSQPISKHDLLCLIDKVYKKGIQILPHAGIGEDKRLSCSAFSRATGYTAPAWPDLIAEMHTAHEKNLIDFASQEGKQA